MMLTLKWTIRKWYPDTSNRHFPLDIPLGYFHQDISLRRYVIGLRCVGCDYSRESNFYLRSALLSSIELLYIALYCIVSIHLYSASCSAHQSETLPVIETRAVYHHLYADDTQLLFIFFSLNR